MNQNACFAAVTVIPVLLVAGLLQQGQADAVDSWLPSRIWHLIMVTVSLLGIAVAFVGAINDGFDNQVMKVLVVMGFGFTVAGIFWNTCYALFGSRQHRTT